MKFIENKNIRTFNVPGELGNHYTISMEKISDSGISVSIQGDGGDFSNYWSTTGTNPFKFIKNISYEQFWSKMTGETTSIIPAGFEIDGKETVAAFKKSLDELGEKHIHSYSGDTDEIEEEKALAMQIIKQVYTQDIGYLETEIMRNLNLLIDPLVDSDSILGSVATKKDERKAFIFDASKEIANLLYLEDNYKISYSFQSNNGVGLSEYLVHMEGQNGNDSKFVTLGTLTNDKGIQILMGMEDRALLESLGLSYEDIFTHFEQIENVSEPKIISLLNDNGSSEEVQSEMKKGL